MGKTCANVWPAFEHLLFDGWLLRFTRGYSRNSNTVWPLYDGELSIEGKITELRLDEWLETAYRIHPVDDPHIKDWERSLLEKITLPRRYAVVIRAGEAVGYGRSVCQGKILNIDDPWTHPDLRSQGLGSQLIHGMMRCGAQDGAQIAYITVNQSNTGAQRLYARLGFKYRYTYRYLVPKSEVD